MYKIWGLILLWSSISMATTKVAVLDTGYNGTNPKLCTTGHYDFIANKPGIGIDDNPDQHGTHVVNAIVANAGNTDYCILVYKVFKKGTKSKVPEALFKAVKEKVNILNLSFTGEQLDEGEAIALTKARMDGIKIFAAAGNEGKDLDEECSIYPGCYNITVVGSTNPRSNRGRVINRYEDWCFEGLCGTSLSAGIATGKYIRGK